MNVPAVVGLGHVRTLVRDGDMLVADGATGMVLVNPPPGVLQEYRRRQAAFLDERAELALLRDAPAVTLDGIHIGLHANIELPEERSEEHTSELQSLMRISYAVFCLKKKNKKNQD